jgi:hypothetical protein
MIQGLEASLKEDYDQISELVPDFKKDFLFKEFTEMLCMTTSRTFNQVVNGFTACGFVPLGDMFNHKGKTKEKGGIDSQTEYGYSEKRQGFIMKADCDLKKG